MTDETILNDYNAKVAAHAEYAMALEVAETALAAAADNYDAVCMGNGDTGAARRKLQLAEDQKRGAALILQQAQAELEAAGEAFRAERDRQTLEAERDEVIGLTARATRKEAAMKEAKLAHDAAIRENQQAWTDLHQAKTRHMERVKANQRGWR